MKAAYSEDGVKWVTVLIAGTSAVIGGLVYGANVSYKFGLWWFLTAIPSLAM